MLTPGVLKLWIKIGFEHIWLQLKVVFYFIFNYFCLFCFIFFSQNLILYMSSPSCWLHDIESTITQFINTSTLWRHVVLALGLSLTQIPISSKSEIVASLLALFVDLVTENVSSAMLPAFSRRILIAFLRCHVTNIRLSHRIYFLKPPAYLLPK